MLKTGIDRKDALRSSRLKVASSVDAVVEMDSEPEMVEIEVDDRRVLCKVEPRKVSLSTEKKKIKRMQEDIRYIGLQIKQERQFL